MSRLLISSEDLDRFMGQVKRADVDFDLAKKVCEAAALGLEGRQMIDEMRPFITGIWMNLMKAKHHQVHILESLLKRIDVFLCEWHSGKGTEL